MVSGTVIFSVVLAFLFVFVASEPQPIQIDYANALTFDWYDGVAPEKVAITDDDRNPTKHLAETSELYGQLNGTITLGATDFRTDFPNSIAWKKTAGFVDTVFFAYRQHHNVIIRPDDVWTAILVQFSLYVNANAEGLRRSFVNFDGKKELVVKFTQPVDEIDISEFIRRIDLLIHENIEHSVYDWITPNFTTTTENDKLTAGVTMMATLQNYFDYELWSIICGIPKGTILGTVDDWKEIRKRVEKLTDYELSGKNVMAQWSAMLGRILDEFISVKEGNRANPTFWKEAIRVDYKIIDLGCARENETTLNGWITAFTAFSLKGKYRGNENVDLTQFKAAIPWLKIKTELITPGLVHVPIKIYDEYADVDERNYMGAMISGHMGYALQYENTLQPLAGWIMMITNDAPRYIRNKH